MSDKRDNILEKLEKMESQRKCEREDSYFFALVFSLALFFITFPSLADFTSFFQEYLRVPPQTASDTALFLKVILILGFVAASGLRYYGAINENEKCKYWSLECFILVLLLLVFGLLLNGLGSFKVEIVGTTFIYHILLFVLLAICTYIVGLIESGMLNFYLKIGQLKSRSCFPIFHVIFMFLPLYMLTLDLLGVILGSLLTIAQVSTLPEEIGIVIFTAPAIISVLILIQYALTLERKLGTKFVSEILGS